MFTRNVLLTAVSIMVSAQAMAAQQLRLECRVAKPCAHAQESDLGYCVTSVGVYGRNGSATMIVKKSPPNPALEIKLADSVIVGQYAENQKEFVFADEDRENWIRLSDRNGGVKSGSMALEQDFGFNVTCQNKAIGLE